MILHFRKMQMYVVWQLFNFCSIFHLIPFSVLCLSGCRALKRQIDNVESSIAATVQEGSCRELWQSHVGAYPDSINFFSMFSALIPYFQNEFFFILALYVLIVLTGCWRNRTSRHTLSFQLRIWCASEKILGQKFRVCWPKRLTTTPKWNKSWLLILSVLIRSEIAKFRV